MSDKNCLQIADELTGGDRNDQYGHPYDDFSRTAKMWSAILGVDVSPEQVGLCMVAVKISRECNKSKTDNLIDGCGYFRTIEMIKEFRATGIL